MKNKGLFSSEKPLSADAIVEKFKKLHQKVLSNNEPKEALVEFVQFYTQNSLPLLFDATNLEKDLEELCWSKSCYSIWDDLIVSEEYRSLLEIDNRFASYQLKPQSSLPSYLLIKGFFYYYRYSKLKRDNRDPANNNARPFLMKSLCCYNFQAFREYMNEAINFIENAILENDKKDFTRYLRNENNIHAIGSNYGAAGYIMLANLYLALFFYYGKIEKDFKLFSKYIYEAYNAIIHAEIFEKYYLNDSYNALQGEDHASLLRESFASISLMKCYIKNMLLSNRCKDSEVYEVKSGAIEQAKNWIRKHYLDESFTKESLLSKD